MKKKTVTLVVIAMLIAMSISACNFNINYTTTENDVSHSTINENGEGTYERTLEKTINGTKYTYYIYVASDDQYKPDQEKLSGADISLALNNTTKDFKMHASPDTHLGQSDAIRIENYIVKYGEGNYEKIVEIFIEKTERYIKGDYEDDYDEEGFEPEE